MHGFCDIPRLSSAPPISERPPRVLVVSPAAAARQTILGLLEGEGCEVLVVGDADEVMRLSVEYEPDLVLVDLVQEGASGQEVCGELKATDPKHHVPVVLVSFETVSEELVAAGLMAGADDFVVEPSREREFVARVRVQLRTKRYLDALQRVRSERDVLRRNAENDPLTGLMNRRALERTVNDRVENRERFGVLFVDADHFKSINDRFGHQTGDEVLREIAAALRSGLRPGDAVARYGGEEFVALIAGAGPEAARLVAERLRKGVERMTPPPVGPGKVTVSIGTAVFDPREGEEGAEAVLRRADVALYSAKAAGRNCVVMYSSECEVPPSRQASVSTTRIMAETTLRELSLEGATGR